MNDRLISKIASSSTAGRLAEQALRDSETTVVQLARELGYASESSFSHAFKRITAVSPSDYRSRERAAASAPA